MSGSRSTNSEMRVDPHQRQLLQVPSEDHPSQRSFAGRLKRGLDMLFAASGILLLLPLLLLIALVVKCTSAGPVLFRQRRFGLRLQPFTIFKFRTMSADADERLEEIRQLNDARGCIFKIREDPRLTPVGRFLRRTSLDELPQLLNVLRGEMSLVGPRPLAEWILREPQERRFYRRFAVLPGMTGLWQVSGRVQDAGRMLDDDLRYVENWTLWRDVRILAATPAALLRDPDQFVRGSSRAPDPTKTAR